MNKEKNQSFKGETEEENNQTNNTEEKEKNVEGGELSEDAEKQELTDADSSDESTKEEDLLSEIESFKEEKIRLLAEMENLRKRFEREKLESIKFGSINLARDILSPGDNLERALLALPKDEKHSQYVKNLIDGLNMVQKEYSKILERNGVKRIVALDNKFDPNIHQAVMEVVKEDLEEGIVVQEIQAGYTMHDRLLRPAMVGVSKKPNQENTSESEIIEKPKDITNKKKEKNKDK